MPSKATHQAISLLIYYVAFFILLFGVATATILASSLVSGGWGIAIAILAFLISTGFALQAFNALRRWRVTGLYRLSFPSYRGVRYPAFHLVSTQVDHDVRSFGSPLDANFLAESDEGLFVLAALPSDRPHEIVGGKILRHQVSGEELVIPREALREIDVFELSDEAIRAAAVDDRSYAERLIGGGINKLIGVSAKRKIVPFAAFMVLTAMREGGPQGASFERLTFAIPTEIHDETMRFMGIGKDSNSNEIVEAAIGHAVNKAKGALIEEGREQVHDVVGDMPLDAADEIIDLKKDIDFWVNIDAAKIATTDGARGRAMARIIAERVRAWSGLHQVYVTTLAS